MAGNGMKSLAKDTAIYGLSSILGRTLNWCLTPLYMYIFANPSEMGKVSALYAYVAVFMVLLTYGLESGFFRFMNKENENPQKVYSTSLISLAGTSLLFIILCFCFIEPISALLKYPDRHEHILMMAVVVALDAFMTIPYAYLRYKKRPKLFMYIRLFFIFSNILLNLFFLVACPKIHSANPELISWFYNPSYGIGYIFLANLISTALTLLMLIPSTMKGIKLWFDNALLKRILKYSFPLMILGIAGVISQAVAQLTYPYIFDNEQEAFYQLGIYTSNLKIAGVITMFIQAFRFAYEPFFFSKKKDSSTKSYADAMKFFVIFTLIIFIGIMFYMNVIEYLMSIVGKNYAVGLSILPIAMMGEIVFGIYFNLSVWYKLTDRTKFGAYFSIFGCVLQVAMNIILVPMYGYIASAWATLISNLIIASISYYFGQKYFPIKYDMKAIFTYFSLAIILLAIGMYTPIENEVIRTIFRTVLLFAFIGIVIKRDLPLKEIPYVNRFFKK